MPPSAEEFANQAHRELHEAIAEKRRVAMERREQRKVKADAESVHNMSAS
jgi:hypothetical protein